MARIEDMYFNWLVDLVCRDRFSDQISFTELLKQLHSTPFRYSLPLDENRALDGLDLRYRFATSVLEDTYKADYISGPCSVLEMMIALSIRCEEHITSDPRIGDRVSQWFWGMVATLGLGQFYNDRYDHEKVDTILQRFLDRDYEPDGRGGLFRVRDSLVDMRDIEIWRQLLKYLNSIM